MKLNNKVRFQIKIMNKKAKRKVKNYDNFRVEEKYQLKQILFHNSLKLTNKNQAKIKSKISLKKKVLLQNKLHIINKKLKIYKSNIGKQA